MKVAIVHPWFPQYRKPFFDEVIRLGSARGFEIDVFHGAPPPEWSERGDSVSADYATPVKTKFYGVGKRHLVYKSPFQVWRRGPHDLLILEQAVRNVETYAFISFRQRSRVAFWGHGKTYTLAISSLQERLKEFLTRRGDWFFAYTPGGRAAVLESGFPAQRITVVQNSIDTSTLQKAVEAVTPQELEDFTATFGLTGKTALFIGGLDESKRLDFLISAADAIHTADPDFRLLIAGSGPLKEFVTASSRTRPWLRYLGPIFGREKARAMRKADVLLMPGRVGLVAVDSFASSTPIITTDWRWHAPEYEYLENGRNALISADSLKDYSETVIKILSDPDGLKDLSAGARECAQTYTISFMAHNFVDGLEKWKQSL